MREEWRPVVGYEGLYDVSDLGRLRRTSKAQGTWIGRILKGSLNANGYMYITLRKDGIKREYCLHQLVASAFIGQCPDMNEVNHKDANKMNNGALNLEYVTSLENSLHANVLGLVHHGERIKQSKLTEDKVHAVRRLLGKESQQSIAKRLNVDPSTISNIATGHTWAWLETVGYAC